MRWIAKAATQKMLSWLPGSEDINYFLQRRIAKNIPRSDRDFFHWTNIAIQHLDLLARFGPEENLSEAAFFEFGAGWDLLVPLAYYALGVNHQTLVDISRHIRFDLINDTVCRLGKNRRELEQRTGRSWREVKQTTVTKVADLHDFFGITYLAPVDARQTGLPAEEFGFISNTATLEHIPPPDLAAILPECWRILKPGGILSCRIDMADHYSYFDSSISAYNFLRFSERQWRLICSSLAYTNRLRRPDYLRLARDAGFEIAQEDMDNPTDGDMEVLRHLPLSQEFREGYSLEDLGVKRLRLVLRKPRLEATGAGYVTGGGVR